MEGTPWPAAGNSDLLPEALTSQSGAGGRPQRCPQGTPHPQGLPHPQRLPRIPGQGLLCPGSRRPPLPWPCSPRHPPLPGQLPPLSLKTPHLQAGPASFRSHKRAAVASTDAMPAHSAAYSSAYKHPNACSTWTAQTKGCSPGCTRQHTATCFTASTAGDSLSALAAAFPVSNASSNLAAQMNDQQTLTNGFPPGGTPPAPNPLHLHPASSNLPAQPAGQSCKSCPNCTLSQLQAMQGGS